MLEYLEFFFAKLKALKGGVWKKIQKIVFHIPLLSLSISLPLSSSLSAQSLYGCASFIALLIKIMYSILSPSSIF